MQTHPEDSLSRGTRRTEHIIGESSDIWRKGDVDSNSLVPFREIISSKFAAHLNVKSPHVEPKTYENGKPCSWSYAIPGNAYTYDRILDDEKNGVFLGIGDNELLKYIKNQFESAHIPYINTFRVKKTGNNCYSFSTPFNDQLIISKENIPPADIQKIDRKLQFVEKVLAPENLAEYGHAMAFHLFLRIGDTGKNNILVSDHDNSYSLYTIDHENAFKRWFLDRREGYRPEYPQEIIRAVQENPKPYIETIEQIKQITNEQIDNYLSEIPSSHVSSRRLGQARRFLQNNRDDIEYLAHLQAKGMESLGFTKFPYLHGAVHLRHKDSINSVRSQFIPDDTQPLKQEPPLQPSSALSPVTPLLETTSGDVITRASQPGPSTAEVENIYTASPKPSIHREVEPSDTRNNLTLRPLSSSVQQGLSSAPAAGAAQQTSSGSSNCAKIVKDAAINIPKKAVKKARELYRKHR